MTADVLLLGAGLIAGVLHVLSGPDHLAALLPIAVEQPRQAVRIGVSWSLGHGLGVLVLGGVAYILRGAIDIEAASAWAEAAVGLVLLYLGVRALRASRLLATRDRHPHSAFAVGVFHGLAGTAHLVAVLPVVAAGPTRSALYLAAYLFGAIAGMAAFALAARLVVSDERQVPRALTVAGTLSIGVGLFWVAASMS